MRGRLSALLAPVVLGLMVGVVDPAAGDQQAPTLATAPVGSYTDGQSFGDWAVVFAGYGSVQVSGLQDRRLTLAPMVSSTPAETHAALVLSRAALPATSRYEARVRTVEQLRRGSTPNPWETGWLVVNYTDNEHFDYVALKTNGWELGKRDPAYPGGQRFLATGATPAATVGTAQRVVVRTQGATITVTINGRQVTRFTDRERPYLGGRFGFYTEDARVVFDRVSVG